MNIVFRADASIEMGTGHIMRCLTLADALAEEGIKCHFICREHSGHLLKLIKERGHQTHVLPLLSAVEIQIEPINPLAHTHWLDASQEQDAEACLPIIKALQPDWLIVDHYALDERWQNTLRPYCKKLMVIDDLADRVHNCDLLLDQNLGRDISDYQSLTPRHCTILCGPQYALLRKEFAQWREYSLKRRNHGELKQLLINLGGVDKDNLTTDILQALIGSELPFDCHIVVVMGSTAPWIEQVKEQAQKMPWPTDVKVGANNMAEIMANSDLAIGAAGSTSWERCCLGLPTIMIVLAENQKMIANALEKVGAAILLKMSMIDKSILTSHFNKESYALHKLSAEASDITNGIGVSRILERLKYGNNYAD